MAFRVAFLIPFFHGSDVLFPIDFILELDSNVYL